MSNEENVKLETPTKPETPDAKDSLDADPEVSVTEETPPPRVRRAPPRPRHHGGF